MTCYKPKLAKQETTPNHNGKYPLLFWNPSLNRDSFDLDIPCGKCDGCRADQAMEWSVRMWHESQMHDRNCMITLTYDEDHLPEDGKLSKPHCQEFLKRLRHHSNRPIRYVLCGEYGETTHRAHYHAAIFGEDFLGGSYSINDDGLYNHAHLEAIWKKGATSILPLNEATCCYVAGYVNKKLGDEETFAMQSRRPPIGKPWLEENIHLLGNRHTLIMGGRERPIPKKYYDWKEEELAELKETKQPKRRNLIALTNREKNSRSRKRLLQENKI